MRHLIGRTVPALVAGAVLLAGCSTPRAAPMTIEEALAAHTDEWMAIDGVEGTGIGLCNDVPCIKVFVSRPPEDLADAIPDEVHGHRVELEPTGRIVPR